MINDKYRDIKIKRGLINKNILAMFGEFSLTMY